MASTLLDSATPPTGQVLDHLTTARTIPVLPTQPVRMHNIGLSHCWICRSTAHLSDHDSSHQPSNECRLALHKCEYCKFPTCRKCMDITSEMVVCRPCRLPDRMTSQTATVHFHAQGTRCGVCLHMPAWTVCDEHTCGAPLCLHHSIWAYRKEVRPTFYKVVCHFCSIQHDGARQPSVTVV